jgi:hypothetical protein
MDEADRKLWDLLGHAPRPAAPPFFAAKVMRQIQARPETSPGWLSPVLRWLAPATIAALFALAFLPSTSTPDGEYIATASEITTLDLVEIVSPTDYEVLTTAGWPYDNGILTAGL